MIKKFENKNEGDNMEFSERTSKNMLEKNNIKKFEDLSQDVKIKEEKENNDNMKYQKKKIENKSQYNNKRNKLSLAESTPTKSVKVKQYNIIITKHIKSSTKKSKNKN